MKATSALFLMASAAIVIIGCGGTNGTGLTGTNTSTNGGASSSSSGSTTNTSGSTTTTTSSSGGGNPVFAGTYVSSYTRGSGSIAVDMNSQNQIKVSFYDSSAGSYYGTGNLAGSSFQLTANSLTGGAASTVSGTFNDQNCQVHISGPFTVDSSTLKSDYMGNTRWYGNNYRALLWTGTLTGTATLQGSPLGPIKFTVTDGGDIYGHLDLGQDIYRGKGKVDNSGHFTLTISSLNGLPQYQLVGEVYPADPTTTAAIAVISDSNNHTGTVVASQSVPLPLAPSAGKIWPTRRR